MGDFLEPGSPTITLLRLAHGAEDYQMLYGKPISLSQVPHISTSTPEESQKGGEIMETPKVGDVVIFCDPKGQDHNALVTAVWTPTCINVVFISIDETRKDSFGRQIERSTSVGHGPSVKESWVHGMYWRRSSEEKLAYRQPLEV